MTATAPPSTAASPTAAAAFLQHLRQFGHADAVVDGPTTTGYDQLLEAVRVFSARIDDAGIRAGDVVAVGGGHSAEAAALLLSLADARAIVLPIGQVPPRKRDEFIELGQARWTIELSPKGDSLISRTGLTADHPLYERLRAEGAAGLVLFSSGTTGRSKASVLNLDLLLTLPRSVPRPDRILSFLTLDHIGGINTLLHTLRQGGALVTIAERTPESVFEAIARHAVTVFPTTPTFLTMSLVAGSHLQHDSSSLRLVTYGTEPMPQQTLARLAHDLPHVRLKQTYGLSELGILATRSKADDSLWVSLGGDGFDHRVVDGVLWIKARTAMLGYLNAEAPFDSEGYFNTEDAVEVDGDYLRILGRTSEVINVGGEKVYPNEVESVLLEMKNVREVTVAGRPSAVMGAIVEATIRLTTPEDPRALRSRIDAHCAGRLEPYKIPAAVVVSEAEQHSDRFKKRRAK